MKNTLRKIYLLLFACSAFLVSGCAELVDCVAPAKPDLHSKTLTIGTVGDAYADFIEADVANDPHDDDYDYFFSITGNFPPGMFYHEQGTKAFLTGIPSQAGTYKFKVRLTVDPKFEADNRICFGDDTITKEYTIVIQ